jgi:aspartyl-tRNA(Asn)/glutamyl-tRNA(Gln) amidotransferase subunit A
MAVSEGPAYLNVPELLEGYRDGSFSPVQIIARTYDRIAELNPAINAHWHLTEALAERDAHASTQRWRAGVPRALEGLPIGIKDVIDVADQPCTGGSRIYRRRRARVDATVVARLRAAGAIVVTKDATTEFGIGGPLNPAFGPTRNPWQSDHWTGGSSCGAASGLAAGTIPLAIGTDAGGSVRMPAAWSGVVGLKPTMGRVSRRGVMPCSWHAEVIGPMARTVSDAWTLLTVISGFDPADSRTVAAPLDTAPLDTAPLNTMRETDIRSLRIGVAPEWWEGIVDSSTRQTVTDAVEALRAAGARIVPLTGLPCARELHDLSYEIVWAEAASIHASHNTSRDMMDPVAVQRLSAGRGVTAAEYFDLLRRRAEAQRRMYAALEPADVLLTPTTITTAPRLDSLNLTVGDQRVPVHQGYALLTAHANLTGFPAIAVPAGFTSEGLPLSLQFTGRPWREATCCRAARAWELLAGQVRAIPDLTDAAHHTSPSEMVQNQSEFLESSPYLSGNLDPGGVDPILGPLATPATLDETGNDRS